jgi:hypothetical protein
MSEKFEKLLALYKNSLLAAEHEPTYFNGERTVIDPEFVQRKILEYVKGLERVERLYDKDQRQSRVRTTADGYNANNGFTRIG